jgi:hypothetical protein
VTAGTIETRSESITDNARTGCYNHWDGGSGLPHFQRLWQGTGDDQIQVHLGELDSLRGRVRHVGADTRVSTTMFSPEM